MVTKPRYYVLTRFSEMIIAPFNAEEEEKHEFEVGATSDYDSKFDVLWDTLSKEAALQYNRRKTVA